MDISVCISPKFGQDCANICHCRNAAACTAVTGECTNDLCAAGWQGSSCSVGKQIMVLMILF